MSVKLVAAAVVLVVGIALASLFPRTHGSDPMGSSSVGVALRRETPASQTPPNKPSDRTVLSSPEAAVTPERSHGGRHGELAFTGGSHDRVELRSPPTMPAEYRALAERSERPAILGEPDRQPARRSEGATGGPPQRVVHRVVDGDTLPDLAARYLGNAALANRIWRANRERLPQDPNILPIGVDLQIPLRTAVAAPRRPSSDAGPAEGALTRLVPVESASVVADAQNR